MKIAILLFLLIGLGGCNTYTVMKDCKPLNPQDEELKEYSACHKTWKFWQ